MHDILGVMLLLKKNFNLKILPFGLSPAEGNGQRTRANIEEIGRLMYLGI